MGRNILISGSTGLIGSALAASLAEGSHRVGRLVRPGREPSGDDVRWDPAAGRMDAASLAGWDVVVHLAGENISGRWTARKKARIRDSRVAGTVLLAGALASLESRPELLICASGIGYYGRGRSGREVDEDAPPGEGFLAEVAVATEAAAAPAVEAGIRVVHARLGMVLSAAGGALKQMLPAFRLGVGGRIGSGRQYWNWIALPDVVAAVEHVISEPALRGPVNFTSPRPVTNRQFTAALAGALGRRAFLPMPGLLARLLFGQMADELILSSVRVRPRKLMATGFRFGHETLEDALAAVLG